MQLDIFSPKAPPLFGLDISSSSVKMLEIVDAGKGAYRVERYVIEPLPRDATVDGNISNLEMVVESVKRGYKRLGTRAKHVAMAVPTGAVITKKIIVPASLRENELEVQVESEANQYIPFALEEVNLDFQVVGPSPNSPDEQEVMIAATRKEKVEDRVAVAESAGLKAAVMDIESFAQQAALGLVVNQLPGAGKDLNVAIVDIGANVMNVSVIRNEQSVYTREQAFGGNQLTQDIVARYGMSVEEAESAKRSGGLPDDFETEVLRPFMENLSMEVQRALQFFFTSTQYHSVDQILLAGGSAVIPGMDEVVQTRTQVPAMVANPFAAMQASPRIQMKKLMVDAPSLIVACGLAMRRFDPMNVRINLLPHREERRQRGRQHFAVLGGLTAALGAAIVGAGYLYIAGLIDNQDRRNAFLRSEIAKLDKEIAEIKKLKDEIAALLARKQIIETLQADRAQTVHLLDQLVRQMPEGVYLRQIRQRGLSVNVQGYSQSNARVSTLMRNIESSPWLASPQLIEIKAARVGSKRLSEFNMNLQLKRVQLKEAPKDAAKAPAKKG